MKGDRRNRAVGKYLEQHAEAEARAVRRGETLGGPGLKKVWASDSVPDRIFDSVVVIPCFGEGRLVLRTLRSLAATSCRSALVILVLNARESADAAMHEANDETRRAIRGACSPTLPLVLIDRAASGRFLPEKEGVGLARKIGCDLALAWIDRGVIRSPWICCTDADAILPADYFDQLPSGSSSEASSGSRPNSSSSSALLYPFRHRWDGTEAATRAILLYECFLRYQLLGLRWAESPYAFHTIGSTIAVSARAYAAVRGVPRRMAGEDFYFLNKLAKVGRVERLHGAPVELDGRISDRVPFGTGRAMTSLQGAGNDPATYELPRPVAFVYLRCWLRALRNSCTDWKPGGGRWDSHIRSSLTEYRREFEEENQPELEPRLNESLLRQALESQDAFAQLDRVLATGRDAKDRTQRAQIWFDAFRTLKLLHTLRDLGCADQLFMEACSVAPFLPATVSRLLDQGHPEPSLEVLVTLRSQFEAAEKDL